MPMKCILLAAGLGTRLKPTTDTIPKPLIRVNGKLIKDKTTLYVPTDNDLAIIDYAIGWLNKYGIEDICVNIHHLWPEMIKYLGGSVIYSYEPELLGTAGTIKRLQGWLDDEFVVVNGDTIFDMYLNEMIKFHHEYPRQEVTVFTNDTLTHNGGVFIFNKSALKKIPDGFSLIQDLLPGLHSKLFTIGRYYDVGTPEKIKYIQGGGTC